MARRFVTRSRKTGNGPIMVVVILAICVFGIYELYRWLVPFASLNPLWQEATIGQTVLDDWRYAGQDAEGYLKFYNSDQTVLLPPNARLFDANGRFIVLEQHTPSSVTYALPVNAIPMSWLLGGVALLSVPVLYIWFRIRSLGGFKPKRSMRMGKRVKTTQGGGKPAARSGPGRFRPSSTRKGFSVPRGVRQGSGSGRFRAHK